MLNQDKVLPDFVTLKSFSEICTRQRTRVCTSLRHENMFNIYNKV